MHRPQPQHRCGGRLGGLVRDAAGRPAGTAARAGKAPGARRPR